MTKSKYTKIVPTILLGMVCANTPYGMEENLELEMIDRQNQFLEALQEAQRKMDDEIAPLREKIFDMLDIRDGKSIENQLSESINGQLVSLSMIFNNTLQQFEKHSNTNTPDLGLITPKEVLSDYTEIQNMIQDAMRGLQIIHHDLSMGLMELKTTKEFALTENLKTQFTEPLQSLYGQQAFVLINQSEGKKIQSRFDHLLASDEDQIPSPITSIDIHQIIKLNSVEYQIYAGILDDIISLENNVKTKLSDSEAELTLIKNKGETIPSLESSLAQYIRQTYINAQQLLVTGVNVLLCFHHNLSSDNMDTLSKCHNTLAQQLKELTSQKRSSSPEATDDAHMLETLFKDLISLSLEGNQKATMK